MKPRPNKKRKPTGANQIVEYGRDWKTPPPELPGKLIREVVIGKRKPKRRPIAGKENSKWEPITT